MPSRTSPIWGIPEKIFRELIQDSFGPGKVLEYVGLKNIGRNSITFHTRAKELNIDLSHFSASKARVTICEKFKIDEILIKNSKYKSPPMLKKRILKLNLIPYICKICKSPPEWNGQDLVLILDHENGDRFDARIENLRFICPNCNSQLPTFCGRNRKNPAYAKNRN